MNKTFKYSGVAVRNPEDEITFEVSFEEKQLLKPQDIYTLVINKSEQLYRITAVRKIDHVLTPNLQYDYAFVAVAL